VDTAGPAFASVSPRGDRRAVLCVVALAAALLCGVGAAALVLESEHYDDPTVWAVFFPLVGWSFIGTGVLAWLRRPESRVGLLMVIVGFAWFLKALRASDSALLYTLGFPLGSLYGAAFIHLLLSFPSGRLGSRSRRVVAAGGYVFLALVTVPLLLVSPDSSSRLGCEHDCPRNLLRIEESDTVASAYVAVAGVVGVALLLSVFALTVLRWRRASRPERRTLAPVLATGGLAAACFAVAAATGSSAANWAGWGCLVALPFAFLVGVLRSRLARASVGELVLALRSASSPGDVQAALARALGDPGVVLAYWLPEEERYVSADGTTVSLPEAGARGIRVVEQNGERVAALVYDESLEDERALVDSVVAAAAMALENARLQAEARAHLAELTASRARIVKAGDEERRRLERDLHDGAQQRFVTLSLALSLVERRLESDPAQAGQLLTEARNELVQGLDELRELARGIHPAVLTQGGLGVAVETLAARSPVPVTLDVTLQERLPEPVEIGGYFVVSEALTNVAKYAQATAVVVAVGRTDGTVVIEVRDNGVGGAKADAGSGIRGLTDRVEALGGQLSLYSSAGHGTTVRAEIPCA
jgi:signal transduction histidine kinase